MKPSKAYVPFLLAAALALLVSTAARADESTAKFKFSDPSKPGTLKIHVGRGDISVRGADASEITVVSESSPPDSAPRKDGLRVLTASSSYSFSEKDNVATLDHGAGDGIDGRGEFSITVPRNTSVVVSSAWGGDITCSDLAGSIDVKCLNGDVVLNNLGAGANVETMSGSIRASIRELRAGQPICLTSMNGAVTVSAPAGAKANVRLRTQNGAILTDFDEKALVTKTEISPGRSRHGVHIVIGRSDGPDRAVLDGETREAIREASRETAECGPRGRHRNARGGKGGGRGIRRGGRGPRGPAAADSPPSRHDRRQACFRHLEWRRPRDSGHDDEWGRDPAENRDEELGYPRPAYSAGTTNRRIPAGTTDSSGNRPNTIAVTTQTAPQMTAAGRGPQPSANAPIIRLPIGKKPAPI